MTKFKIEVTEGIFPWGEVNPISTAPRYASAITTHLLLTLR